MRWPKTVRVYPKTISNTLVKEVEMDKPTLTPEEIAFYFKYRALPPILYNKKI